MNVFKTTIAAAGALAMIAFGLTGAATAGNYNGNFMIHLQGTYLYTDDDMGQVHWTVLATSRQPSARLANPTPRTRSCRRQR